MRFPSWALAALLGAAAAACDSGNEVDGTRGPCGFGGDLSACAPSELTPQGACTRLVACAAIPLDAKGQAFDWGRCVQELEAMSADAETFVVDCVAQSTCDALKSDNAPRGGRPFCFAYGRP